MPRRAASVAVLAAVAAALASCFEEPVVEQLELRFLAGGSVEVVAEVTLRMPQGQTGHPALSARFDALQAELLGGTSAWSRRFAAIEPAQDGQAWQRRGERLEWFRQWATADPAHLADFFADTPVQASYQRHERSEELALFVGPGTRATAAEVRRVDAAMDRWFEAVAAYEAAAFRVWRYVAAHPDRRRACLGQLFSFELAEGESSRLPKLLPREEALLEPLGEAMDHVDEVLQVPDEEADTLEELARRVYDPFPARVRVRVPGHVLAAEGFARGGDETWEVPVRSPWTAFAALASLWLAPDPMLARIERLRGPRDKPFDLDAFLARPVRLAAKAPGPREVRQAMLAALTPPASLRLEWEAPPATANEAAAAPDSR